MKYAIYLIILVMMSSCATVNVKYDYDKQTDFNSYKTYNYYADMDSGLSGLDNNRLLNILDDALSEKGLSLAESPDFYINIQSVEFEDHQRNTVGVGIGGGRRNVGGGISVGLPLGSSKSNRELIVDFIDDDRGLFWQAVAEASYNTNATPEKREANLKAIVDKILAGYPPNL
ncbi:MAG: DUF4136 domain-containing protein [Bacteroidia bacterium]|nr:DUF4136 domain-containing protein [Bacteroidia bacterium]NND25956.1 DUF4136 domain-containing protein [Flavobacteriaceae bacterium]MBT8277693.1 DUF4136 domain-containing protein [Bacteroidia bacterium]NNK59213.1 DUF4136 domain-containing protein [Flavobacteriaceae bacterium]NNL32341.1 DUF4136 domain-containing protein [Flavobacteriaceae bacterium]